MIKLSKRKKLDESGAASKRRPFYLRLTKDINDVNLPKTCELDFPDANEIFHFKLAVTPDEGYYKNYRIVFDFKLPTDYPYEPPKVKCETEIHHPNIDAEGNVCLNILREDWRPVLSINSVIYGLQYLLLEPNADDALNETAARQLKNDFPGFICNVKNTANGRKISSLLN